MQVECLKNCDADLGGGNKRALFAGQTYELPDEQAAPLIEGGALRAIASSSKAVDGPPTDKAVEGPESNKARRGRRGK